MRIVISTTLWGEKNRNLFAGYSVESLLASGNIPALQRRHEVTCHIVTSRADWLALWRHPNIVRLARECDVDIICMEDYDLDPAKAPGPTDQKKYEFVTKLQNIAIKRSLWHHALVFNYADFIWADGSLPNAVALLEPGVDAVLSFCLPVDLDRGSAELQRRGKSLPPRALADLSLSNLHAEAQCRYWDAPEFTSLPSYLLFRVDDEGVVIRAFHQTALVVRVKGDDPHFARGIVGGTLDGSFTGQLAARGQVVHADDSDRVMVMSLHDGACNPRRSNDRGNTMAFFLAHHCDERQRTFADRPLRVRRNYNDAGAWRNIEQQSGQVIAAL